tara:strand:- start:595 stop:984 length:390 start_codon:yes stop_codon:yes gene_type:complete
LDKDLNLYLNSIFYLFFGSSLGLTLRIFINNNFKIKKGFYINDTSLVNFIASFFLGILVAFNPVNNNLLLLFYSGFLGCFSTFSSFIYQLFVLFRNRQFVIFLLHYIEVLVLSFLSFYLGYYLMQIFQK